MASVEKDFIVKKGIVVGSGILSTAVTTASLFDTATALTIGATTGTTTVRNALTVTGNITGNLIGNASTATTLQTARSISLSGDVTGSVSFDGGANVTITTTIAANSVALGTDTTGNYAASVAVSGNGLTITGAAGEGTAFTVNSNATDANTASTLVFRDATGSFSATNITLSGDIAVNGGDLTTTATTFNLVNTTATTLNFAGAATTLAIGATTGTTTVRNNLTVTGNLVVNGTTTTVNSTTVTIDDPIFTLGGDVAPGADDNKDRGIEFRYHNGTAAKVGFFGYDDSTGKFTFIPDATNTAEVFAGAVGAFELSGSTVFTVAGNTGSTAIQGGDTVTFSGTAPISVTVSGDTATIAHANSGVTAASYGSASSVGTFTVNAGGHITAASNVAIAITSAAVTDFVEAAQDAAATALVNGTHQGVTVTYDDANNKINIVVDGGMETDTTAATATPTSIYNFPAATYRSAKLVIQAVHATAGFEVTELLLIHNGTDVHTVEYGDVFTGASSLASYTADITGGNVVVTATPVNTNTTFTVIADRITV